MSRRTAWLAGIVAGLGAIVVAVVLVVTLSAPGSNTAANTSARMAQPTSPHSAAAPRPPPDSSLADVDLPAGAVFAGKQL